jgi:hypothetical protein
MSEEIKSIPSPNWDIFQTAAWIETRDLAEVERCYLRIPARESIAQIAAAWRAGTVLSSGEIDGASRRALTCDDAMDYSIIFFAPDAPPCADVDEPVFRPHSIFPQLYGPDASLDSCLIVFRSRRVYPEQLVHDRYGAVVLNPDGEQRMRHRFIHGLLFNRKSIIEKWEEEALPKDLDAFYARRGFASIQQIATERELKIESYFGNSKMVKQFYNQVHIGWCEHAKRRDPGFESLDYDGGDPMLLRRCERFLSAAKSLGLSGFSAKATGT